MDTMNLVALAEAKQGKPADVVALLTVLGNSVGPRDDMKQRVAWLLDLAAALDALTTDGAAELADMARKSALSLVSSRLDYVAGKSR